MHPNNRVTHILILHAFVFRATAQYGLPIEVQRWDAGRKPLEHMVDATNQFGLKVLYEHNFLNENNIAFSPYGLTGILVALYEGVEGDSSIQIQRSVELPRNRNYLRIGFRDIHRTLKTYFIPEEGFLAGLALNKEIVTFKEGYREVLNFYGFDLEADPLTRFPSKEDNSTTVTTLTKDEPITVSNKEETTPAPPLASPLPTESSSVEPREPTPISGTPPSPLLEASSTMVAAATTISTVAVSEESSIPASVVTTTQESSPDAALMTEPPSEPTLSPALGTTMAPSSEAASQTPSNEITPSPVVTTSIGNDVELISTDGPSTLASVEPEATPISSPVPAESSSASSAEETATDNPSTTEEPTGTSLSVAPMMAELTTASSMLETLQRRKRSILDFIMDGSPLYEQYLYERPIDISSVSHPMFSGDQMFLANGLKNVEVAYMLYDTVLEYTYLPHFKASAIKLPLDNENYYLLVILPDYEFELNSLIKRLSRESNLRDIYSSLQHRYVRACVPSFMVKGFVTLTTDLQRLGIRDVFEPRQNDFSPMTAQRGVYVRNVEQAITVTIRKYENKTSQKSKRPIPEHPESDVLGFEVLQGYMLNQRPVHFSATYPFLYFVMDSSIHVALMAGKLMDPLNTRVI